MLNANRAKAKALEGLQLRDCQYFAYYLGALVHLISDATYYPHVYDAGRMDGSLLNRVNYLTNTIYPDRTTSDFFNINEARTYFDASDEKDPLIVLYEAAVDTKYGNSYHMSFTQQEYEDAEFLFQYKDDFWPLLTAEIQYWTIDTRNKMPLLYDDAVAYFNTLEHNLNTAIYYSAVAINYIINRYYADCGCTGEIGEDGPMQREKEPMGERIDEAASMKNELELFDFMGAFGIVMTLAAISIVKKLNELAKLHDVKFLEKLLSPLPYI